MLSYDLQQLFQDARKQWKWIIVVTKWVNPVIFRCTTKIVYSDLIRENTSHWKPAFWHILEIELHLTIFNVSEFFLLLQEIGITASADNTVRVWSIPNSSCAYVIKVSIDQLIFTCSKSTRRTLEKSVKYVQS